jgi:hypothetical protein
MTAIEICNLALDNLGVTNKITALTDTDKEGKACARWYANTRDLVLRSFPWPFASRFVSLTEVTTEQHLRWPFLYAQPADFLMARRVFVEGTPRNPLQPIPYARLLNAAGTAYLIGADTADLCLEYGAQFDTDAKVALLPAGFVDALAWKLATRLVIPLALEKDLIEGAEKMYRYEVANAFAVEAGEGQADPLPDSEFITAREG